MDIKLVDPKQTVRRGQEAANHAIDVARDLSKRKVVQARHAADELVDIGDEAVRRTTRAARSAHDWMEEKPHLAALAALAAGVILGAILSPRR